MEKFKLNPILWISFFMLALLLLGLRFFSSALAGELSPLVVYALSAQIS